MSMNFGLSGPIENRDEEVVKERIENGLTLDDLHLIRQPIDGGIDGGIVCSNCLGLLLRW